MSNIFESLSVQLKAENSSGEQHLHLTRDDDEFWFTLTGTYEEKRIQIDFDCMNKEQLEEVKIMLELIMEEPDA